MSMHWGWWLVWSALFLILIWAVLNPRARDLGRSSTSSSGESAEQLLRRRFAAGEIDEEEFDRMMQKLRSSEHG